MFLTVSRIFLLFLLSIIFYFCAVYQIEKYFGLALNTFDLGYFQNLLFNSINGDYFFTSLYHWNELPNANFNSIGDHLFLLLPLFLPICFFSINPLILNFVHIFLMLTAIYLVFEIAYAIFKDYKIAFLITALSLFNNYFLYIIAGEFHFVYYFIIIFLSAMFFLIKKKYKLSYILFAMMMLIKETMLPAVFLIFIVLFLKTSRKIFLFFSLISLIYFFIGVFYIMPKFRNDAETLKPEYTRRYSDLIENPDNNLILEILQNPQKLLKKILSSENLKYYSEQYKKFLFLPIFSIINYCAVPTILINALSSSEFQKNAVYHYDAEVLVILITAFIFIIYKFQIIVKSKKIVWLILLPLIIINIYFSLQNNPWTAPKYHFATKKKLSPRYFQEIKKIPESAAVAVDERSGVYFAYKKKIEYLDYSKNADISADYIVFYYENNKTPNYYEYYYKILTSSKYKIYYQSNDFYILQKK